jgi:hypothetical protein
MMRPSLAIAVGLTALGRAGSRAPTAADSDGEGQHLPALLRPEESRLRLKRAWRVKAPRPSFVTTLGHTVASTLATLGYECGKGSA